MNNPGTTTRDGCFQRRFGSPITASARGACPAPATRREPTLVRASTTGSSSGALRSPGASTDSTPGTFSLPREYALLLVEAIERRAADGEDYFDLLTDGFTRELPGDDGYATLLLEFRSRWVADGEDFWSIVVDLRQNGHLGENDYGQLLEEPPRPRPSSTTSAAAVGGAAHLPLRPASATSGSPKIARKTEWTRSQRIDTPICSSRWVCNSASGAQSWRSDFGERGRELFSRDPRLLQHT